MALADLQTRLAAIDAQLAAMTTATAGGKPDISGGAPGTVEHVQYRLSLYQERKLLLEQIEIEQGGWEWAIIGRPD